MHNDFDPNDLTSERSLWDIYRLATRIRAGKLQLALNFLTVLFLGVHSIVLTENVVPLLVDVRSWAQIGFNFAITTLGFLVAGFTIFTTVAKPDMMLAMMSVPHKESGLPTLKVNMFAFMRVFIAYLVCAAIYLVVFLFCQTNGLVAKLVALLPHGACIKDAAIRVAYVMVGWSFVYLLLMLKSFVFNIYAIVMNMLRWEHTMPKK